MDWQMFDNLPLEWKQLIWAYGDEPASSLWDKDYSYKEAYALMQKLGPRPLTLDMPPEP